MVSRSQEVATDAKQILHDTVNRCEPLELSGRLKTPHLALTLSGRLMGDLRAVVRVLIGAVRHRRHHRATGSRVATQLVGDQASRYLPLVFGSPKVRVGPELAEGAPGGPVTGAFPGFSLGVLVMGQGPVEARGKRAVFSKARWARLCVRGAGSFHRACPFVTSSPRGALLHLPRVQLVKSRCPYDLRCTCVIFQPERWGPNSQTLAPLRVRAHRGDHAL